MLWPGRADSDTDRDPDPAERVAGCRARQRETNDRNTRRRSWQAEFTGPISRREFLKRSTVLAAMGMGTSLTPQLIFAESKVDLSGVEIDYWNMIGVQNKIIRQQSEQIVKAFE